MDLFKSKLERFMAIRALVFMLLLSIIDIIVVDEKWHVLVGLISGTILGILRFGSNALILSNAMGISPKDGKRRISGRISIVLYVLSQLVLLPVLLLSYYISKWVFAGFAAGMMMIPLVTMVNSITEAFGITKNHFE